MGNDIEIRRATIDDLDSVQRLSAELAEFEYQNWDKSLDPKWPFSPLGEQTYRKAIENRYVIIAFYDKEAIGYLIGNIHRPGGDEARQIVSAQLNNIYVREAFRQRAVGSALLIDFRNYCKNKGVNRLTTTVIAQNVNAVDFYQRHGFEPSRIILAQEP